MEMNSNPTLYHFTYSQDVIRLQSKYALFKRVLNILFSVTCDEGFDEALMEKALNLLYERNDCLRLRFVKQGKETMQYFEPVRTVGCIRREKFTTSAQMERFFRCFRRKPTNLAKGDALRVVFAVNPEGKQMIIFKICHYVADTYGIGILVNDLFAVYNALRDGKELPEAPGSFEEIVRKDNEYRNDEAATTRDKEFFLDYYKNRHAQHPVYCGPHGNGSDRWLKLKRKGKYSLPYLMVRCDTEGYQFVIPSAITEKVVKWCTDHGVSMNAFFFFNFSLALSLINDRETRLAPVEILNCRGTVADRKAAGTKAQGVCVCTEIDYAKSFAENVAILAQEQNELYRHTRLTYLEGEAYQHEAWKHSMLGSVNCAGFSFIPFAAPEGINLQIHSNGKGALVTYVAMMHNLRTNETFVNYDVQRLMITPWQLIDFQNVYVRTIEAVLADSESPLEKLF